MIPPPRATGPRRRQVLIGAGLAVAGLGTLAAGCTVRSKPEPPDPLTALVSRATADAALAKATGAVFPDLANVAALVADNRTQHATALGTEVHRVRPVTTTPSASSSAAPPPPVAAQPKDAESALISALQAAEKEAAALVPGLPRYRAGLVGSVAASCAALGVVVTA